LHTLSKAFFAILHTALVFIHVRWVPCRHHAMARLRVEYVITKGNCEYVEQTVEDG